MKLLVMGGSKAVNVINVLNQRFGTSIQYVREDYIRNFERIIVRGETFDRAIIFWQAITEDGALTDKEKQRNLLANAIKVIRKEILNFEIIFVVNKESMARMVLEETLDIKSWTVVLVKSPPMYAAFFTDLVKRELKDMDKSLVFSGDKIESFMKKQGEEEEIIWSNWIDRTEGEVLSANIDIDLSSWGAEEDVMFSDNVHKELQEKIEKSEDVKEEAIKSDESNEGVIDSSQVRENIKVSEQERNKVKKADEKKKKKILSFFR